MKYIINVAELKYGHYVHYFRVEANYDNYDRVYQDLVKAFPDCEVTVYRQETLSYQLEMEKI